MNHLRVGSVAIGLTLGVAALARPATGQAATDQGRTCAQLHRTPAVGSWATYTWTGGRSNGTTMRMAVVGQEPQDGKTYYWYEVTIADPARPNDKTIMQMLVADLGAGNVRSIVMKSGQQPAMKLPPQMIQMVNSSPGMNMAADLARQCQAMAVVGWEQVTVPGGQFRALHLRSTASGMVSEVWLQPDLQFAMVKSVLKDGGAMALGAQGTGAKSSITETPQEMPGLPGAPPPN
ncbi:MAG TPA: hypothetical protein VNJ06_07245 [Gemmatimonadales bacterium]|nr:hypothetical protein [Gemmatimonadales bacterium]